MFRNSSFAAIFGAANNSLSARIDSSYDSSEDVTVDGHTIPIIASDVLTPVTGQVSLSDGSTTFGPYSITCENDGSLVCSISVDEILSPGTYTVTGFPLTDGVDNYPITGIINISTGFDSLLLENGDFILLESGDRLLLE